ncbi:MAG: hypothetical protein JO281_01135 [Pseudonocardiales bacterium]|nr:hypothetical protein [Pseudonocardiales bacterium]
MELPRTTAAFHLDRLVDEDLLDVTYQRRTGRTGPGAGRAATLYRQSDHHVAVLLPPRRYDLAGWLLSSPRARRTLRELPRAILYQRAREVGTELGETARPDLSALRRRAACRGPFSNRLKPHLVFAAMVAWPKSWAGCWRAAKTT